MGGWLGGWVAGLLENKANLNSSFSLVEVEVRVELGKRKRNGVFSGHYVIASSLPPERLRPNDGCWNAARSCQFFQ